ncbi:MAG: CCA tRNA nucleotidyltransferase [Caulobacteraceae bacterium]
MAALTAAGGEGCARFVGGCVRDSLLRRPVGDIDIATTLAPDETTAALRTANLKAIPTGAEHGTITAVADGKPFQITTLRRDVETDGRHAVVAFTDDWAEDAARRDFRLNALYADIAGHVFDPTGAGLSDLAAGAIVFVGDPATRIREDALRIPRFFRFMAWHGRGEPDAAALAACAELRELIAGLSGERLAKELLGLLAAEDPRPAMRLMAGTGVLGEILPDADGLERFDRLVEIENDQLFTNDPLLRLASLLSSDPAAGMRTAARLRLSNTARDRLAAALEAEPALRSWMSPREVRRAVWRLGAATLCDRAMLAWASLPTPAAGMQWRALLPMARGWMPPTFPLTGADVLAAGAPPGPMVGAVLREVEAWWIDADFPGDRLSAIERLKAVVQGMVY